MKTIHAGKWREGDKTLSQLMLWSDAAMYPYNLIFTCLFYFKICFCIYSLRVSYVHICIWNIFTPTSPPAPCRSPPHMPQISLLFLSYNPPITICVIHPYRNVGFIDSNVVNLSGTSILKKTDSPTLSNYHLSTIPQVEVGLLSASPSLLEYWLPDLEPTLESTGVAAL